MWIISHKSDSGDLKTWLHPNRRYIIGRDSDADFIVNSTLVSRQQLELNVGELPIESVVEENDVHFRTPLEITVLSRARTLINDKVFKLSKSNVSPIKLDYTNESRLEIKFKDNSGEQVHTIIEWVNFSIVTDSEKESLTQLVSQFGMDLRITTDVSAATHYFGANDLGNNFKASLIKGLPILNSSWYKYVTSDNPEIDKWFYQSASFISDKWLLPNHKRSSFLNDITFACLDEISWIRQLGDVTPVDCLIDGVLDVSKLYDILSRNKKAERFLAVAKDSTNVTEPQSLEIVTESSLFECVKTCSPKNLSVFTLEELKAKFETMASLKRKKRTVYERMLVTESQEAEFPEVSTQDTQPRKRIKYERVDTMHFFDMSAKEEPKVDIVPVATPEEIQKGKDMEGIPESDLDSSSRIQKSLQEQAKQLLEVKSLKRTQSEAFVEPEPQLVSTKKATTKKAKLKPKVSLVDAIIQAKENATKSSNMELCLDEAPDISGNLMNLAIVEDVEIAMRAPMETLSVNPSYSSRKNFKNFKKNVASTNRPFVELSTVNLDSQGSLSDDIIIDRSLGIEKRLEQDFRGLMNEVKRDEPQLFVPEEDEDSLNQEVFTVDSVSTLNSTAYETPRIQAEKTLNNYANKNDEDEDDEDEEQPRFGFSRPSKSALR